MKLNILQRTFAVSLVVFLFGTTTIFAEGVGTVAGVASTVTAPGSSAGSADSGRSSASSSFSNTTGNTALSATSAGGASGGGAAGALPTTGSLEVVSPLGAGQLSPMESFYSGDGTASVGTDRLQIAPVNMDLRQFGYDFFSHGGFMPDQQALVGPDYVIGSGDTLLINVWGSIEGNYSVTVDRNGEIILPKVGVINLWGQSFAQCEQTIRQQIAKYYKDFQLNITMGGLRSIQIFLVGEVKAPGTYQISSLSTLVTALSSVGGPAKSGTLRNIELLRNGKKFRIIDLYDFFLRGDKSADLRLQSGDTIFVPIAGSMVGVAGNVRRPAIYELTGGETLQDALNLAGGLIPTAFLHKVQINRVEAHQARIVLDLDLGSMVSPGSALQAPIQDRDIIKVAPIAATTGYVTLDGYVARPGSYQLAPGMRLIDLIIPYDNLLPEFYPELVQIIRINPPEFRPESLTISLDKALQGDLQHNLLLQEYDIIRFFSRREMEELPEVTVSGAVLKAGTYRLYERMTVKDLLTAAGNVKRSAYLGDAEMTRYIPDGKGTRSERLIINLERALTGDSQANILLSPYDHLVVRSIPDLDARPAITITGKVLFPGTYTVAKGEKMSSVLARAGGFSEGAYLRGALFTRESVKAIQRERLDKLIFEQEQEISRVSADIAAGALSPEEAQSATTLLVSRKAMVEKIKKAPVTGRMVVNLLPLDKLSGSNYDFEMMAGDNLFIPENPQSVAVLGQVYNPISLVYQPGMSVSHYLDSVGGATKNAEKDDMFIVRADGTVFSKQQAGMGIKWDSLSHRWVFGGFNVTEIYAGDTILVPEKIEKTYVLRDAKDITTIIYQMALGAAAVASF